MTGAATAKADDAIAITGLGIVSPIGVGEEAFFRALDERTSAVAATTFEGAPAMAARVGEFGAKQQIAPANLRRLPRLSQMAIVAAKEALAAGELPYDLERVGVVLGTGLGTLDETIGFMRGYLSGGPEAASPLLFPSSVMNAAAGQLALECKLRGVNTTVNHKDASPLGALLFAVDLLRLGRADALLCGAVDELNDPVIHGYRRLGAMAPLDGAMRPYDDVPSGLHPGEGATVLLLERLKDATRRQARVRGVLVGRGESSEDRPRVGWGAGEPTEATVRALSSAAQSAHAAQPSRAASLSYVAGGGNGTVLDRLELGALERAGVDAPVSSVLAQVGESFSSGMARVASALYAIERQRLPGTVGLARPLSPRVLKDARPAAIDAVLVPTLSQGGSNTAVVIARP
jgi:3-oxoacyl-[acyl-carrier-protein] synthase II